MPLVLFFPSLYLPSLVPILLLGQIVSLQGNRRGKYSFRFMARTSALLSLGIISLKPSDWLRAEAGVFQIPAQSSFSFHVHSWVFTLGSLLTIYLLGAKMMVSIALSKAGML